MKYIIGQTREQILLLPDCVDDLIRQDNPVRVIDAFIDSLNKINQAFRDQLQTPLEDLAIIQEIYLNFMYMDISIKYALVGN